MKKTAPEAKGWKPIPLPLRILVVVMAVWTIGSAMNLLNLMENGLPLFGRFVFGWSALIVVLTLDFVGPLTFIYALWQRKRWTVGWAFLYLGVFIGNGLIALFTVREQMGIPQILVPTILALGFLTVIFWQRNYFAGACRLT